MSTRSVMPAEFGASHKGFVGAVTMGYAYGGAGRPMPLYVNLAVQPGTLTCYGV